MKHLKTYRMFESSVELTPEQIEWLDKCTDGTWQLNSTTGEVDVDGNFNCRGQMLSDFNGVRFGEVKEYFNCNNNQLTSLVGAPQKVGWGFDCNNNRLTSLVGAPQKVGGYFSCSNNGLTSLEGAPLEVGGDFECRDNQLTSLEGAPQKVGGSFDCKGNGLTSLEGAPREVGGYFHCDNNQLTTLVGAPQEVGGYFWCHNNQLTSLEGAPREVGEDFICHSNPVSKDTLGSIFEIMETGKGYLEATESIWSKIPVDDQTLLYRPEFEWVVGDERKKLDALRAYQGFKGMI